MADGGSHPSGRIRPADADQVLIAACLTVASSRFDEARVDRLEAAAFCITRQPAEAMRPGSGWPDALDRLARDARALGVGSEVQAMIDDLFGGDW